MLINIDKILIWDFMGIVFDFYGFNVFCILIINLFIGWLGLWIIGIVRNYIINIGMLIKGFNYVLKVFISKDCLFFIRWIKGWVSWYIVFSWYGCVVSDGKIKVYNIWG